MVVDMYIAALWQFGGSTSDLLEEPSAFSLFAWLKAHLEKLPAFVRGAVDFGALVGATNFAKMLAQKGCPHMESIQEEKLEGPSDLGTTPCSLRRSVQNFMKSFWINFGKETARTMAEVVFFSARLLLRLALPCVFWVG
jgi:hypothetical protein